MVLVIPQHWIELGIVDSALDIQETAEAIASGVGIVADPIVGYGVESAYYVDDLYALVLEIDVDDVDDKLDDYVVGFHSEFVADEAGSGCKDSSSMRHNCNLVDNGVLSEISLISKIFEIFGYNYEVAFLNCNLIQNQTTR